MRLPERALQELLDTWPVAVLATLAPDGTPHQVPIVFARSGGVIWSPVDGKPKHGTELARLRHVAANPRVCLLLDRYDADWSRLWWIRVDGSARVVRIADPESGEHAAAVAGLRAKYPQYARVALFRDTPTLLRIEVSRLRSWCAGPEALPGE
jgi:PPOX class probable F420-dependent enzyme